MREIKFRAWDEVDSTILYADDPRDVLPLNPNDTDLVAMQYTGLKDKNGVEIYEGDVVKPARAMTAAREVAFSQGQFVLRGSMLSLYGEYSVNDGLEVIGNIYENPELLEKAA